MLKLRMARRRGNERGDTLIEVTLALTILGAVLVGAISIVTLALRTGQDASERTQIVEAAQSQMEALRNFRDNHTWAEFQSGSGCGAGGYCGVDQALSASTTCLNSATSCFHMELQNTGFGVTQWVPVVGELTPSTLNTDNLLSLPSAIMDITSSTALADQGCGFDFDLAYQFNPRGGSGAVDYSDIPTQLVNLGLQPGGGPCP